MTTTSHIGILARRGVRLLLINLCVLLGLIGAAYLLLILDGLRPQITNSTDARVKLPTYEGQSWPARHFQEVSALDFHYLSYSGWRTSPVSGETLTVLAPWGERRSFTPTTEDDVPEVFFFGGSAMWGLGARDDETIPSAFAKATGLRVRNFGELGYTAHQSLQYFIKLMRSGERPSHVIFYDGANDVTYGCHTGLGPFAHAKQLRIREAINDSQRTVWNQLLPFRKLGTRIRAKFFGPPNFENGNWGMRCEADEELRRAIVANLLADWRQARRLAAENGVKFDAFLQPTLGTTVGASPVEYSVDVINRNFRTVYPLISQSLDAEAYHDIQHVLDGHHNVYIDDVHVAPSGNKVVALKMAEILGYGNAKGLGEPTSHSGSIQ